jgi:hypothetical protein
MNSSRQLIRWGLPGWICCLFLILFIIITFITNNYNLWWFINKFEKFSGILIMLAAVSIPIGFIIYQFYYCLYWYIPIPLLFGKFTNNPNDRGKEILSGVSHFLNFKELFNVNLEDTPIDENPAYPGNKWYSWKSIQIMNKFRSNWQLSDSVWYYSLKYMKNNSIVQLLEHRNQMISDIYHSLGASYTALTFSFIIYLFLLQPIIAESKLHNIWMPIMINLILFITVFLMLRREREASYQSLLYLKQGLISSTLLTNENNEISDINSNDINNFPTPKTI